MPKNSETPVVQPCLVRFLLFIGCKIGNMRKLLSLKEGKLYGRGESTHRTEIFGSSDTSGTQFLLPTESPYPVSPQQPCCKRDEEEASPTIDVGNQTPQKYMLHTMLFGSPADLQMLLEVEAAQGLLNMRETRMRQRLIGRETYLRVLYGVRHSDSVMLKERHLPSLFSMFSGVVSWIHSFSLFSSINQSNAQVDSTTPAP